MTDAPDPAPDLRSAVSDEIWSVDELVASVRASAPDTPPFDDSLVELCGALSRELLSAPGTRGQPAAVALGYWLRPASVARAREAFRALEDDRTILVPRGTVFHVTPANVDTMFAYSWIPALLAGNANIVRLSARMTDVTRLLLGSVARVLGDPAFERIYRRNHLVFAGHDDHISRGLSSAADVRVVWGGDATVEHFRAFPLPPRGRDVTFPNRHSFAIINADAVAAIDESSLADLADRFFSDAYWFDQGACSSPRLIVWSTRDPGRVDASRRRFRAAVADAIRRRGYVAEPGIAVEKLVLAYRKAAAIPGVRYERNSNEATWVELPDLTHYDRDTCGGGIFFEVMSHDLAADLLSLVSPEDQTVACFGLEPDLVRTLARRLNGRGIDRWVPIGRALEFGRIWDGYDLLQEFSRRVVTDVETAQTHGATGGPARASRERGTVPASTPTDGEHREGEGG